MGFNMHLKIINNQKEAVAELKKVQVDPVSIKFMAPKMSHYVLKVKALDVRAANVLKQEMLAKGAEAAVAKWTSSFTQPTTDVLLIGTLKQLQLVIKKLKAQPYGLKSLALEIEQALKNLSSPFLPIKCGNFTLPLGQRTLVMGILNVTPDSFSDGGLYNQQQQAIKRGLEIAAQGADIIDVGGESTRPGSEPVAEAEELKRVLPVIEKLAEQVNIPISIDTKKAKVAEEALKAGASMVNDITGFKGDPAMPQALISKRDVVAIAMHIKGEPKTMQLHPVYEDLIAEISQYLRESVELAVKAGLPAQNVFIDPGFGFGKTVAQNLEILRRLSEFKTLGQPIAIGTSRKSTIGKVLGDLPVSERLEGTAATVCAAILNGANLIRVHDVKEMVKVAKMSDAIKVCHSEPTAR